MAVNEDELKELIGRFVTDFGAAMHAATVVIGDKLGLYKALAEQGPVPAPSSPSRPVTTPGWSRSG